MKNRDTGRFLEYPPLLLPLNPNLAYQKRDNQESQKGLALYVHVPFCTKICHFCPYVKRVFQLALEGHFLDALLKELKLFQEKVPGCNSRKVNEIFLGGGTPLTLSCKSLDSLLQNLLSRFDLNSNAEITVESNPVNVDKDKLQILKDYGITRLSLGIQSFHDDILFFLGSPHRFNDIAKAIELVKNAGFDNLNLDLMYRIPGQTFQYWQEDMATLISFAPEHFTTYACRIESGTAFYLRRDKLPEIPTLEIENRMFDDADKAAAKISCKRYSIDHFSLPGKQCRYGFRTVSGDVAGFGPGAYTYYGGNVYVNSKDFTKYEDFVGKGSLPIESGKFLDEQEQMERFLIKRILYLSIKFKKFKKLFGVELPEKFGPQLQMAQDKTYIQLLENRLVVTRLGMENIYDLSRIFYGQQYKMILETFPDYFR